MRLDPDHASKIARAFSGDEGDVKLDLGFMVDAMNRLNMWERGLLTQALTKAAQSKRKTVEQRALLALFVHDEGGSHAP